MEKDPPRNKHIIKGKDFSNKNHKTLKKEMEEATRRWKDLPCSWIRRNTKN
jgi:hypothetical protein